MLSLNPFARAAPASLAENGQRQAIIDIGSNSIRLVVFDGPARLPAILFNEKIMAGLGRNLSSDGKLDETAIAATLRALQRFRRLTSEMGVERPRTVATAAVRDASNAGELLARMTAMGLETELLSGEQEAEAAGLGVISAIPEADGVVGDLGGGSLELIRVARGGTERAISLPLGVLRIGAIAAKGPHALRRALEDGIAGADWLRAARGRPFYMVGGSWRALARLDMELTQYPLPVIHHYRMAPERVAALALTVARLDRKALAMIPSLSSARIPTLGDAAALLDVVIEALGSSELIVSASGLREGLLYGMLTAEQRGHDPLIVAAREEGARQGRFPEHGDLLDRWIAPLFLGELPGVARLRLAACLLADVGWRANPEFRAERGIEMALHGNWVGVDAEGRAMIAQALATSFGSGAEPLESLKPLAPMDALHDAALWGLAMRLGQRFSGGVAGPLSSSRVAVEGDALVLHIDRRDQALYGEMVERRHKQLATALGLTHHLSSDARLV